MWERVEVLEAVEAEAMTMMMHEHAMVMMKMSVKMRVRRVMRVMRALTRFFGAQGATVLDTVHTMLVIAYRWLLAVCEARVCVGRSVMRMVMVGVPPVSPESQTKRFLTRHVWISVACGAFFKNPDDRLYTPFVEFLAPRLVSNTNRASSIESNAVVGFVNTSVSKGSMPLETMFCDSR